MSIVIGNVVQTRKNIFEWRILKAQWRKKYEYSSPTFRFANRTLYLNMHTESGWLSLFLVSKNSLNFDENVSISFKIKFKTGVFTRFKTVVDKPISGHYGISKFMDRDVFQQLAPERSSFFDIYLIITCKLKTNLKKKQNILPSGKALSLKEISVVPKKEHQEPCETSGSSIKQHMKLIGTKLLLLLSHCIIH